MEQATITHIFKNNITHLSPIRQTNSLTTVDSNFTKHMVKYQSARTSTQISMPANSTGGVWQTSKLIQRSWQHRICNLICFRTITSYFYEHLPPWNGNRTVIVRRAGLLWSQQDFEWRWSVPLFKCLTVLEFSVILFDLCLSITFFNFIMNYVPIVTFWIFTYHKIWLLSIMFCFIWSYWIIYFLACLEVSWRVVS